MMIWPGTGQAARDSLHATLLELCFGWWQLQTRALLSYILELDIRNAWMVGRMIQTLLFYSPCFPCLSPFFIIFPLDFNWFVTSGCEYWHLEAGCQGVMTSESWDLENERHTLKIFKISLRDAKSPSTQTLSRCLEVWIPCDTVLFWIGVVQDDSRPQSLLSLVSCERRASVIKRRMCGP